MILMSLSQVKVYVTLFLHHHRETTPFAMLFIREHLLALEVAWL